MRRFEYVGGTSEKFWEISRTGAAVTVRFGRNGTNGQTQVKTLASDAAAATHVDKLVAAKVKKGYVEIGARSEIGAPDEVGAPDEIGAPDEVGAPREVAAVSPAGTAAADAAPPAPAPEASPLPAVTLPDEDALVLPAAWLRSINPRRDRPPVPPVKIAADAAALEEALLESHAMQLTAVFDHVETDNRLADAGQSYLIGRDDPTPLGAACTAMTLLVMVPWHEQESLVALADGWVQRWGLTFAAEAGAELGDLYVGNLQNVRWSGMETQPLRRLQSVGVSPHWLFEEAILARLRAHLAAADDGSYAAARDALASHRTGTARQRLFTAYLCPSEQAWVEQECVALTSGGWLGPSLTWLLGASLGTPAQFAAVAPHLDEWQLISTRGRLCTLAQGVGPDVAPALAAIFDKDGPTADSRRWIVELLSALPTDEAFQLLVDRLDQKYVGAAALAAAERFPVRAVRLLAAASRRSGAAGRAAGELLQRRVLSQPEVTEAMLPLLDAGTVAIVEGISSAAGAHPEAPIESLPPVLRDPPWLVKRKRVAPVVVAGLAAPDTTRVLWEPGERERWLTFNRNRPMYQTVTIEEAEKHAAGTWSPYYLTDLIAQAPEPVARHFLARWQPARLWDARPALQAILAKYELAAVPALVGAAQRHPADLGAVLAPVESTAVALVMADWLGRLKSARSIAVTWLHRHDSFAARALIPSALAKAGKERRAAEGALRVLAQRGAGDAIARAARTYGAEAAAAIDALLAMDPADSLPSRIPQIPAWVDTISVPQVLVRDRQQALPRLALPHVVTMLALSKPGEVYVGVDTVKEVCDPTSLAELAWRLFQQWQTAGMPAKDGWAFDALGWFGDDETVRRLAPLIRAWPGEGGHTRAVKGLDVLATIGSDVALMHLYGISQKVKFKALKERAQDKIQEVADDLELSTEQLADRLVPDFGLDADGSMTLDYGPRQFRVGFDEQLKPVVMDGNQKLLKNLPKPGAKDDPTLAPAAWQRFAGLKKDVRTVAADQIRRLDLAMITRRRWTAADHQRYFVDHPLLWHIVRRLVWATFDDDDRVLDTFRVAEDRTLATVDDDTYLLAEDATVGIPHPLDFAGLVGAWSDVFGDYEILQPFLQLGRDTHTLRPDEMAATELGRFVGPEFDVGRVYGLQHRGWEIGAPQDAGVMGWVLREVPAGRSVVIELDPGIPAGYMDDSFQRQHLTSVWLNDSTEYQWGAPTKLPFGELDDVTASEVLRDLTMLLAE